MKFPSHHRRTPVPPVAPAVTPRVLPQPQPLRGAAFGGGIRFPPPQAAAPKPPKHRNPFTVFKNVETVDGQVKSLVHNPYNSPAGLYSEDKIAETLAAQAEVLASGAVGVDFRKNEKKFDGHMSEVLQMVRQMDEQPEAFRESPRPDEYDACSPTPPPAGFSALRTMHTRSLTGQPEMSQQHFQQTPVHAPRIQPQQMQQQVPRQMSPLTKVGPPVPPKPCPPGAMPRGAPGLHSTSATLIRRDPETGQTKLITAVDTETRHFNAFNRTPQSFKGFGGAPQGMGGVAQTPQQQSQLPFGRAPQHSPHAQMQPSTQQFPGQTQLSQVDYTSYVPQRKAAAAAPRAPPAGGMPQLKLGLNGASPAAALAGLGGPGGFGGAGGPGGDSGGKSSTAGCTNAPKRGRGQRKQAGSGLRIPVCAACGSQIRGPFIAALGQCWCPGCFVCMTPQCRQNLENIGFVEVEDKIHCETCWENFLAPVCSKCQKRIREDCLKACGTSYHPQCFACAYCGGLFGNSAFFMEDGLPYCENDWNELFTTKCVGCGFPIEAGDRWVEALNKNFHAQCFKCAICGSNLEGQSFLSKQGRPFCKHHARM